MLLLTEIKMRLDVYICENGLCQSRTEAKDFITAGAVSVNGVLVNKPSFSVNSENVKIEIRKEIKKYVSRGGLKLEAALDSFKVNVEGALALDVGASSGGFTDCLLKRGAFHVIAVDSGTMQLNSSLREDGRVTSIENFNARFMKPSDFEYVPNLAVMDVSFISATYIIPALYECLATKSDFVCLIKPQFEVGRANVGKGGIVKDEKIRLRAVQDVIQFANDIGFEFLGIITSPIKGGDGNIEYLAHFKKNEKQGTQDEKNNGHSQSEQG